MSSGTIGRMLVGIQGQAGSFHEHVAKQWYGDTAEIAYFTSFANLFDAYEAGDIDAVVAAVENTLYGSINDVYQLVERCSAPIIGEVKLPITHNLIARPGAKLGDITEIYSQIMALSQCHDTVRTLLPMAEMVEYFDTAAAVEYVKSLDSPHAAAIASEQAAHLHGMTILRAGVQDDPTNITRFLILEDRATDPMANRASLVITTSHKPGALAEVLAVFANAGINLVKLQSQPIPGKPFEYKFFIVVDAAGNTLRSLVAAIEKSDHQVTLLGEYVAA